MPLNERGRTGPDSPDSSTTSETGSQSSAEPGTSIRYDQGWLSSFARPLLIVILATCLSVALVTVLRRFLPMLTPLYADVVIILGVMAAVVGCVTTTWLAQPAQRQRRTAGYRFAELGLLLVFTRLVVWIVAGNVPTPASLFRTPITTLFDGPFIVAAVIVSIAWIVATELSSSLLAMALQPDEIKAAESGTLYRDTVRPDYSDRGAILNGFATQWVIGGILLVILASATNMGFSNRGFLAIARQNISPVVIAAVVIYFLVGLMLLSHGQLAILRARWALEQTPTRESILRYWPAYAFIALVVIGLFAGLMPFGGTYWLARLLSLLFNAAYFIVFFILQLFGLLFALIMSLFPAGEEAAAPPPPPIQPMMPPPQEVAPSEFLEVAGSTVFWLLALLILGYAAYIYFTDKGVRFTWLAWIWAVLRNQWRQMGVAYGLWQRSRVDEEREGVGSRGRRLRRWLPWSRRPSDPDARARYYYHAMLDEARSKGIVREKAETPHRFAPRLSQALPEDAEMAGAIEGLTDAFVDVRYANVHLNETDLPLLDRLWKNVRRGLRL